MRYVLVFTGACAAVWAQGRGSNLQVLQPTEVGAAMNMAVRGTGLTCEACHVGNDRASDDKYEKLTARKMLAMVKSINATAFDGKEVITCYTCHRGSPKPVNTPPAQAQ